MHTQQPISSERRTTAVQRPRGRGIGWLPAAIGVLVMLMVGVGLWLGYRELAARAELRGLSEQWSDGGELSPDQGLALRYRQTTHQQASAEWSRVLFLLNSRLQDTSNGLPYVDQGKVRPVLDRNAPWRAQAEAGVYLDYMAPVLAEIHQAADGPTPVWQPIAFAGYGTLLEHIQNTRSVSRLLQLDAEYALHQGDAERAWRDIRSLHGTAAAIDIDIFMVAQLVHVALQRSMLEMIQRSLHTDVWNDQQLQQLAELVQEPFPVREKFLRGVEGEQLVALAAVQGGQASLPAMQLVNLPTTQLALVEAYRELHASARQATGRLSKHMDQYERQTAANLSGLSGVLIGQFLPAVSAYARALENGEESRQMTLTAIGLKRFELQHRRWPASLSELKEVGLSPGDWTIKHVGPLGYSHQGGRAYVWGIDPQATAIASERPELEVDANRRAPMAVVLSSHEE